jgi:hypothetical protein
MATDPSRSRAPDPSTLPPAHARAHRRGLRTRGGGWLLPEPALPRPDDRDNRVEARGAGRALAQLESALDTRSSLDRCRWLRLAAEAGRWGAGGA